MKSNTSELSWTTDRLANNFARRQLVALEAADWAECRWSIGRRRIVSTHAEQLAHPLLGDLFYTRRRPTGATSSRATQHTKQMNGLRRQSQFLSFSCCANSSRQLRCDLWPGRAQFGSLAERRLATGRPAHRVARKSSAASDRASVSVIAGAVVNLCPCALKV